MITGVVQADEGRIRLKVKGPKKREQEIEAVIDTGYTAALSLPPSVIAALGLRWQTFDRGLLADGSECLFDVYEAEVIWDGKTRRLLVDEADTDPLVGMALLRGYELKMQIRSRGRVTFKRLSAQWQLAHRAFFGLKGCCFSGSEPPAYAGGSLPEKQQSDSLPYASTPIIVPIPWRRERGLAEYPVPV